MFILVGPLNQLLLVVIFVSAVPLGRWIDAQSIHAWPVRSDPVSHGTVVNREAIRGFGGIPAGRLLIKIEKQRRSLWLNPAHPHARSLHSECASIIAGAPRAGRTHGRRGESTWECTIPSLLSVPVACALREIQWQLR
jgi:hypothetical protein